MIIAGRRFPIMSVFQRVPAGVTCGRGEREGAEGSVTRGKRGWGFRLDVDVDSGFERVWGSGVRDNSRRTKA